MQDADNVDRFAADEIKDQMRALGKAVVALTNITPVFACSWACRQPGKTLINVSDVAVGLCLSPHLEAVGPDALQIIPCTGREVKLSCQSGASSNHLTFLQATR